MGENEGLNIHQDAWFQLGKLEKDIAITYDLKNKEHGVYAFVIEGDATVNGEKLSRRDGLGITGVEKLEIRAETAAEILLMEVPMSVS